MDEREYRIMAQLEADHWWYRGLRDLLVRVLARHRLTEREQLRVLDAGCGTGENLRLLAGLADTAYLGGFDLSPLALAAARSKAPLADVYCSDIRQPSLHSDRYDLILSCDVLSEVGMAEAREGVRCLADHLAPDGRMILNLPAFSWLFSGHDIAVSTRQRTTVAELRDYLQEVGLTTEMLTYRLCTLFPAIVARRLPSLLKRSSCGCCASDVRPAHALVNRSLTRLLAAENSLIVRGWRMPWGSSVFAVARRSP